MWIPTPIYERLPQCLVLLGLLFISSGFYLGFDFEPSFVYFGTGIICLTWGVGIFIMRRSYRKGPQAQQESQIDA
jgi:hypothetical protein